jgi:protein gp37
VPTKIEWADETINPFKAKIGGEVKGYHCTKISEGCLHCYAEVMNLNDGYYPWANGIPYDGRKVEFVLDRKVLDRVTRWRRPRRVFVQSMSDLFHEDVPDELIIELLHFLAQHTRHIFMLLTKRPGRMKRILALAFPAGVPPHIWPGVTAENQAWADVRLPELLSIPAAVHYVSVEPMLGPVNLGYTFAPAYISAGGKPCLDLVIAGCETGRGRRPMLPPWARGLKDQCVAAGVAFFLKQMYRNDGTLWRLPEIDGRVWNEYPEVKT